MLIMYNRKKIATDMKGWCVVGFRLTLKMKVILMFAFVIIVGNLVMALYMSNAMKDKVIAAAQEKLKSVYCIMK